MCLRNRGSGVRIPPVAPTAPGLLDKALRNAALSRERRSPRLQKFSELCNRACFTRIFGQDSGVRISRRMCNYALTLMTTIPSPADLALEQQALGAFLRIPAPGELQRPQLQAARDDAKATM